VAAELILRPYQEIGVNWLSDHRPHKLLADDMGLGKTPQCIAAMNLLDAKTCVVICPSTVKIMWARRIAQWSTGLRYVHIVKDGKTNIPPGAQAIIVNYELVLRPKIYRQLMAIGQGLGFDVLICDEARYLKSMDAQRTKKILGKNSFLQYARRRWMLDGTPVPNRPVELYPILKTLAPDVIEPHLSYYDFGMYFCRGRKDGFGYNMSGASNIEELNQRLTDSGFMLRRTKEEVMDELPDKIETIIEIPDVLVEGVESLHIATARRDLGLAKIPAAATYIAGMLAEVNKVVVFAHHRDTIETLSRDLAEQGAVILYGGMTAEQKQKSIDAFVSDPQTQVLIGQTVAGGTGVDGLQGVCNHMVFVEVDWSPGVMDQAIDRLRRIGQKRETVFVHYLVVPDSLDTMMDETLKRKRNVIERLMKTANEVIVTMTIEQQLAEIIGLLKVIAGGEAPADKPAKGKGSNKKETTTQAADPPVQAPAPAPAPAPATEAPAWNEEAVRMEISKFLASKGDRTANAEIVKTKILPLFNVTEFAQMKAEDYPKFVAELAKGVDHWAASGNSVLDDPLMSI
jgi:SWI/SNF-related matrix-associated actin-dependent regulator 1 of chromatin subfamily A